MKKDPEPRGEFARYAFGYSDKKPRATVAILILMFLYLIWRACA